jgi:hypothetical protein
LIDKFKFMKISLQILLLSVLVTNCAFSQVHHFSVALAGGGNIPAQTAGIPFFIEIVARDSINGTADSFTGTVDVSSTGNLLEGNGTTDQFIAGVLSSNQVKFSNIGLFEFTVTQTSGTATGVSNTFLVNHGTPSVLRVETKVDGSGIVVPLQTINAGSQIALYAISRDTLNNFVSNQSSSVWSIQEPAGGIQTTDISPGADSSSAIFTGYLVGSCEIRATAQNLTSENSERITVIPGIASKLLFTQQPTDGTTGAPLSPSSILRIADDFGNFVPSAGDMITLSIPPLQGILNGFTSSTTNDTGLASFDNLSIPFTGEKTLIASSGLLTAAISDSFELKPLIIIASTSPHGVISPNDSVVVLYGSDKTFSVIPDLGYHVDSLFIDNLYSDSTTNYTFNNITTNHSIRAIFSINKYTITSTDGINGTISPAGSLVFNYGSSQSYSMTANFGYHIDSVFVDGLFVGSPTSYLFDNISVDHNIDVTFEADIPTVNAKIFLQGAYNTGTMTTLLSTLLPNAQPYNRLPWNYNGLEFSASTPSGVVDWILVELRTGPQSSTQVATRAGFVKSDGTIVDTDGLSLLSFPTVLIGNYYIVMHHRNHLSIMSASPVNLTASSVLYDFTTNITQYYGGSAVALSGGKYGMYNGDSSHDGFIDSDDFMGPDNNMFKSGYQDADHSLDGFIDSDDFMSPDNNMFKSSQVPN